MLRIYLIHKNFHTSFEHGRGPLVLGRGDVGRGPWQFAARRMLQDPYVSWDHLHLEELSDAQIRVRNLSEKQSIKLSSGANLTPGGVIELGLPIRLTLGETALQVENIATQPESRTDPIQTLARPPRPSELQALGCFPTRDEVIDAGRLTRWFEAVIAIQRASISSGDFYQQTARAVVELIGLDRGLVLLERGGGWEAIARHATDDEPGSAYSATVLARVREERRTIYQNEITDSDSASLSGVEAIVAAPILGEDDERVVGVVYGVMLRKPGRGEASIRPLEAQLVQVLASAVAAGLVRVQIEADAARRRVQFEQFFSAELARELDRNPGLLLGREQEVTVLFCDLRNYSQLSERLKPRDVCQLTSDVFDRLTDRVREFGGTVVSYSGDGMMALWNAPAEQPDHAGLACQAAIAMHAELPALDELWKGRIGRTLALGIGVNTGLALVGNTGSRTKFMYGPQGHTVNLASRVEGATKQLGVPILITGTTRERLPHHLAVRRLGFVRVVGIESAVELYELRGETADPAWFIQRDAYELGLSHYEAGEWARACQTLYPLLVGEDLDHDLPTLSLVGRCIECMKVPHRRFDPIFDLDHK